MGAAASTSKSAERSGTESLSKNGKRSLNRASSGQGAETELRNPSDDSSERATGARTAGAQAVSASRRPPLPTDGHSSVSVSGSRTVRADVCRDGKTNPPERRMCITLGARHHSLFEAACSRNSTPFLEVVLSPAVDNNIEFYPSPPPTTGAQAQRRRLASTGSFRTRTPLYDCRQNLVRSKRPGSCEEVSSWGAWPQSKT